MERLETIAERLKNSPNAEHYDIYLEDDRVQVVHGDPRDLCGFPLGAILYDDADSWQYYISQVWDASDNWVPVDVAEVSALSEFVEGAI